MVKKKTSKKVKSTKKTTKTSKTTRKKSTRKLKPKVVKETIRVKTFIVEKPVYVETPAKKSIFTNPEKDRASEAMDKEFNEQWPEPEEYEDEKEAKEFDDETEQEIELGADELDEPLPGERRIRSRGLFNGPWWKVALMQGFLIWIILLAFAFFMDLFNLVDVEVQRNWIYLLVVVELIMLIYHKYLKGKIII